MKTRCCNRTSCRRRASRASSRTKKCASTLYDCCDQLQHPNNTRILTVSIQSTHSFSEAQMVRTRSFLSHVPLLLPAGKSAWNGLSHSE